MARIVHPLPPEFDAESRVLILGTMPSPKSREYGYYYAHPQNRFWPVLAQVFDCPVPQTIAQKRAFLHAHHLGLWDVLASCEMEGADDGSIRSPIANDLSLVLKRAKICRIFTTGTKAAALYRRLCYPSTGMKADALPSTSPANCRYYDFSRLVESYRVLLTCLETEPGERCGG